MNTVFFLVLWILVTDSSSMVWPSNINKLYKPRSIMPVSDEVISNLLESIASGTQMAMDYCQLVFKWDRWNCPQSTFSRRSKHSPTKEIAFAKAILSAGIVHAITRNCSRGEIKGCECDPRLGTPTRDANVLLLNKSTLTEDISNQSSDWSWGGCSDDTTYALNVAKKLTDGLEKDTDAAGYVARHNNKVGREIIRDTMVKRCRCHGVSGSCSVRTCWMQVASFGEISKRLREKYRKATRLTYEMVENSITLGNSAREVAEEKEIPGNVKSLIFLEQSPDYCIANATEGFEGTKGRMCSRNIFNHTTLAEKRSCRILCRSCGHKVKKVRKTVTRTCNCNFIWCCEVKCEMCVEVEEEYYCD